MVNIELDEIEQMWRDSAISNVPASDLLLVTDFDGTLSEIGPNPAQSEALPEGLSALRRLAAVFKEVVVLSSRTGDDLARLIPVRGVRLIPDSGLGVPSPSAGAALERFNADAGRMLKDIPGVWLEVKPASTAIHIRHSPVSGQEVLDRLRPLLQAGNLSGAVGRKVIEVHTPGANKGTTLAGLLDEIRPGGLIALGDDENDRPVFDLVSSLNTPHLAVGVSSAEVAPDLFEHCDLIVSGPRAVVSFLQRVVEWVSESAGRPEVASR
jgi:trehalose 6-phosphate phosphatase